MTPKFPINVFVEDVENPNYVGVVKAHEYSESDNCYMYRIDWEYVGNTTKYDTAINNFTDIHFERELKLSEREK